MREIWLHADRLGFQANERYFEAVILNLCHANQFNPVVSQIDGLAWDGTPRLDGWTVTYLGTEDTPLMRKQGAIQLIASVRRIRKPGTKHDVLPVLEGPQGVGKSTAIRILAGDALFTDSLNIGDEAKVVLEQTADAWHVELAELAGIGRRDVESVKSFLSRQWDSARLSYDRSNTRRARKFVCWATTNDDEYLIDPTGNRRFWPWKVGKIDLKGLARDREQLWAEAAHREAQGESIALPVELYNAAAAEQAARVQTDPWLEKLEEAIGDFTGKIRVSDIWLKLGVDSKTQNPALGKRIAGIMKQLGFMKGKQRDFSGKAVNCYWKPAPGKDRVDQSDPWISLYD
jgi:predicted P-loop ATPase